MNVYERFGVNPIINVAGTKTRYGGALMEEEARRAMDEAADITLLDYLTLKLLLVKSLLERHMQKQD